VLALKAPPNSLISRGLLQIKYEASTITIGLRTAEADRKITLDRVTELTISYEFHFFER
jgi:hypothetical protein